MKFHQPPEHMLRGFMEDPKPAPLKGSGSRGGHTPNDIMIDKKIKQKIRAEDKVSKIDKARILKHQTPVRPQSETTKARKEWKNILKNPGDVSSDAAGSVRFQNFWATFKPKTAFNQGIKKRVMNLTMTEKQAILTIKKHRKKVREQEKKDGKILVKNKKIENELNLHDANMYRAGNRADHENNKGKVSALASFAHTMRSSLAVDSSKNFGKYGEIRLPVKKSFADQENILLKKFHDDKVKKVNDMDHDAVSMGYGLGGEKIPGWENSLPAAKVADQVLGKTDQANLFGTNFKGRIKHSEFEGLQIGTEFGAFTNISETAGRPNIPMGSKGASKDTGIFIFPKRVTGKSPNVPDNKNTHLHTKGRDPMVFGGRILPKGNDKKVTQWHNRAQDPLAMEYRADEVQQKVSTLKEKGWRVKTPESWNLGLNPWEQNKQGGDFYTAGQQSYSRNNAKQWRGIGLGLGGVGAMGLMGGQSASADEGKRKTRNTKYSRPESSTVPFWQSRQMVQNSDRTWKFTDVL